MKGIKELTIVIVDSGMGGLSICADVHSGFMKKRSHDRVELIYFNAWPEEKRGYNSLPGHADRVRVFNSALEAMERLKPDLILIACNTLSILYPDTPFAHRTGIPVTGIIEVGVTMVLEHLLANPNSQAIILGTLMTVNSATHQKALVERGIPAARIIGQQCNQLATRIESGPESAAVAAMLDGFLSEAATKIAGDAVPIYAVLCCTHFGYAERLFREWFDQHLTQRVEILNPNQALSRFVLDQYPENGAEETDVEVRVLSRIRWDEVKVNAIAAALDRISPQTTAALRNYHQDPGLFEVAVTAG